MGLPWSRSLLMGRAERRGCYFGESFPKNENQENGDGPLDRPRLFSTAAAVMVTPNDSPATPGRRRENPRLE